MIFKSFIFFNSLLILEIDFTEFGEISKWMLDSFFSDDIEIKSISLQFLFKISKIFENISSVIFLFNTNDNWKIFKWRFFIFLFEKKLKIIIIINAIVTPKIVIFTWFAPNPSPVEITKNKYINSSGSLMAALNLTIDRAPTKPNYKARDDLTIVITKHVVIPRTTKFFEK